VDASRSQATAGGATPTHGPRVLLVTNGWPTENRPWYGIFTKRQVEGLRGVGVEVDVLFVDGRCRGAYLSAARRILGLNLRSLSYDLVHGYTGHSGMLACLQLRYPVVMTYVGYDLDAHLGDAETTRTTIERLLFRACLWPRRSRSRLEEPVGFHGGRRVETWS
jgi:hypothetical protein